MVSRSCSRWAAAAPPRREERTRASRSARPLCACCRPRPGLARRWSIAEGPPEDAAKHWPTRLNRGTKTSAATTRAATREGPPRMRRAVRWGMLVVALVAASPAWADEEHPAASARDAQARFEEGLIRAKAGDFEAARLSFAQAYAVAHKPAIVWNLALTEEKTHRPLEALAHFREWLHQAPPGDPDRARARKHIDELSAGAGHIDVVAAPGAALTVDSIQSAGVAPRAEPIDVAPGRHVIEAKQGGETKTLAVDVAAGQTAHADFRTADALVPSSPGATDPQASGQPGGPIT